MRSPSAECAAQVSAVLNPPLALGALPELEPPCPTEMGTPALPPLPMLTGGPPPWPVFPGSSGPEFELHAGENTLANAANTIQFRFSMSSHRELKARAALLANPKC